MTVVVMVMSAGMGLAMLHSAAFLVAMLAFCLQLQRYVVNSMLRQLSAHPILNLMGITLCHHVHSSKIAITVHAPNVNVMNIDHAVKLDFAKAQIGKAAGPQAEEFVCEPFFAQELFYSPPYHLPPYKRTKRGE